MKPATLFDSLYRLSFRNERNPGWTNNALWRDALRRAKRFVIDDKMSSFMADLSTQAFTNKLSLTAKIKMVENLRVGARLPSEVTWIEYNLRDCMMRNRELLGQPTLNPIEVPQREGWLLMRHPKLDTAFQAMIVSDDQEIDHGDGFNTWVFPVALAWTVDMDTILPWRSIPFSEDSIAPSALSTGITGYETDRAGIVHSDLIVTPNQPEALSDLLREWAGTQRRMWALLSTINDLPVELTEVRAAKGFVARGAYRKYLDYRTITLNVPTKLYRKTIRDALALAHRRGGPVRSHWRRDYRNPLSNLCDHEFVGDEKHMICKICKGKKIWIAEHVRGNTAIGFNVTDYRVTHDDDMAT